MPLPSNLLVATDLSAHTERVLETSFALAERLDAKVNLVHAFTLSELSESALRAEGLAGAHALLERRLREFLESRRASGRVGEILVREGDPATVLVKTAEQLGVDLIVVDSYHHGLTRLVRGSVAESVVRDAQCAVFVLHHAS